MTTMANTAVWPQVGFQPIVDDSDQSLVQRTKAGDTDAFAELVRRNQTTVYNLSYRFMRNAASAEDMSQEAFLKAFRLLKGFRGDCSFSTWMYRVTASVCLTELKRRKKRGEVELQPNHGEHMGFDAGMDNSDVADAIRQCVGKLPDRYATIITLYYLNGIAYDEIAETMNVPLGTLKTWMHRARKKLRKIVEKELNCDGFHFFR